MYCSCVESCQIMVQDFFFTCSFSTFCPFSSLSVINHLSIWDLHLFYGILSLLFSLLFYLFPLSLPLLLLPVWALYSTSRHAGQIWIVLMYLNRHTCWEKPLLLTTACSQWADIGVSFCDWDLARDFKWDSQFSLPALSVLSSHTCTHSYLLSSDKPGQSLLSWFRCGGSLVADIKVRIKCLPVITFSWLNENYLPFTLCLLHAAQQYLTIDYGTVGLQPCMWLNPQHPEGVFYWVSSVFSVLKTCAKHSALFVCLWENHSWIPCLLPYVQEILRPALPTTSEFPVFSPASKQGESELWDREGICVCVCACEHVYVACQKSVVLVVSVVWLQLESHCTTFDLLVWWCRLTDCGGFVLLQLQ